ncbi:MAG: precorrin-4 C(11)-methyltransferase [Thermodesulfobacteriota bacterium]
MGKEQVYVHFVGAGPGDPELITVKGRRLLEEADCVVYAGSLVEEKVLKYCRPGVEVFNSASMDLGEIMAVMVSRARAGKRVVRVHTGDPSLYSAMREQADLLDRESIPYEVVPGVSSAFASAAALKKELTAPGVTQTVIFTRLAGRTPVPEAESLSSLSRHGATMCVFLSASMMDKVVEELSAGYGPQTPAAVVYKATWEDERVITGTLSGIADMAKTAGITRHALIIVGRAVGEGEAGLSRLYDSAFKHGYRK